MLGLFLQSYKKKFGISFYVQIKNDMNYLFPTIASN
jgi:hypothetical protein